MIRASDLLRGDAGPGAASTSPLGRFPKRRPSDAADGRARARRKPRWRAERGRVFNVSRTVLAVIAVIALVLLVLGLATRIGLFGWVIAIILGAYVIAALVRGQRAA
jgi:hypothetical protein